MEGRGENDCLALRIAGGGMTCIHTHLLSHARTLHIREITRSLRPAGVRICPIGKAQPRPPAARCNPFRLFSPLPHTLHAVRIGRAWRKSAKALDVRNVDLGSAPAAVTLHAPFLGHPPPLRPSIAFTGSLSRVAGPALCSWVKGRVPGGQHRQHLRDCAILGFALLRCCHPSTSR